MGPILPFLIVLMAVALFTRVDAFYYLFYCLFGVYALGRFWARRSLARVAFRRRHDQRVFHGEVIPVGVEVHNPSWLPVLWLRITDTAPSELMAGTVFRQVVSLAPRERLKLTYTLYARRRGYYRLGPLSGLSGDLLGTVTYENRCSDEDFVIVYPRIVTLRQLGFPSQSPFGTLPSRIRIFEDPSRMHGVREYQQGDSLRRMDWKTSARVGCLQVRRYEPAISLETAILLNLHGDDYPGRDRFLAAELGIVVAASLAVHLAKKRQAVGLISNGRDAMLEAVTLPAGEAGPAAVTRGAPLSLPVRKGRGPLMQMLDLLARIEVATADEKVPFIDLLGRNSMHLTWGTTVVVITSREVNGLLDTLLALRRRGLMIILVLTAADPNVELTCRRAEQIGIHTLRIWSEQEMGVWQ